MVQRLSYISDSELEDGLYLIREADRYRIETGGLNALACCSAVNLETFQVLQGISYVYMFRSAIIVL